jgi:hypothetical protein
LGTWRIYLLQQVGAGKIAATKVVEKHIIGEILDGTGAGAAVRTLELKAGDVGVSLDQLRL